MVDRVILIVEDNMMIALDLADEIREAGWTPLGPVPNVPQAENLLKETPEIAAAILDYNLGDGTSAEFAIRLQKFGIPVLFLSGDAVLDEVADIDGKMTIHLPKPVLGSDLVANLECMMMRAATRGDD